MADKSYGAVWATARARSKARALEMLFWHWQPGDDIPAATDKPLDFKLR